MTEQELLEAWFVDLGKVQERDITWVIKGLLPEGLTILGGPPKGGKSTLALAMGAIVAELNPPTLPAALSRAPEPGKVFVFSYESHPGYVRRTFTKALGIQVPPDGRIMVASNPWRVRLDVPETVERLLKVLDTFEPLILILDPFRNMHQQDENDSGAMQAMLVPLHEWAINKHASVIMVHHTVKERPDQDMYRARDLRGSGAIFGMADGILMYTPKSDGTVTIEATFKYAPPWTRNFKLGTYGQTRDYLGMEPTHWALLDYLRKDLTPDTICKQRGWTKKQFLSHAQVLINNKLAVRKGDEIIPDRVTKEPPGVR